jgi:pimeloyl-ACP methyl ester carboxylesterase
MQQTWLDVGPVDELAQTIAGLILADPVLNEHWIEGGTHAANLTHPDEVNRVLLEFLRDL